jgi:hypothetical protein
MDWFASWTGPQAHPAAARAKVPLSGLPSNGMIEIDMSKLTAVEPKKPSGPCDNWALYTSPLEATTTMLDVTIALFTAYVFITSVFCFHAAVGCPESADSVLGGGTTLRGGVAISFSVALFGIAASRLYVRLIRMRRKLHVQRNVEHALQAAHASSAGTQSVYESRQLARSLTVGAVRTVVKGKAQQRRIIEAKFSAVMKSIHASMPKIGIQFENVQVGATGTRAPRARATTPQLHAHV